MLCSLDFAFLSIVTESPLTSELSSEVSITHQHHTIRTGYTYVLVPTDDTSRMFRDGEREATIFLHTYRRKNLRT